MRIKTFEEQTLAEEKMIALTLNQIARSDNPFEQSLGHVQWHGHGNNVNGVSKLNNGGASLCLEVGALLANSSTFEFARLLLDSVRRRCLLHAGSNQRAAPTAVNAIGGKLLDTRLPPPPHGPDELSRENNIKDSFKWSSVEDSEHQIESECRAVIENLFFDSIPRLHVEIHSIRNVVNPVPAGCFLQRVKDENACVGLTFHGTQPEHVEGIVRNGTLPQAWGDYVGAHAGVAHLSAEADQQDRRYLCVLLTDISHRPGEPPLQMHGQTHYFGPMAEDRILVSHLITYVVRGGGGGGKRVGGGCDDPFSRRLSSAVQRSGRATATRRQPSTSARDARLRRGGK